MWYRKNAKFVRGRFHKNCYTLVSELGRGGSGRVFMAEFDKGKAALKVSRDPISLSREYRYLKEFLPDGFCPRPFELDDFYEGSSLSHFLSMEYISGKSLRQLLRNGPLTADKALDIGLKLARILKKIQEKGFIYCDLKPENIIIQEDGRVRLIDLAGVMRPGSSIREFTNNYDRASWNKGPRIADEGYNLFSLACIIIEMLEPKRFQNIKDMYHLLASIRSKYPKKLYILIRDAVEGKQDLDDFCKVLEDMYDGFYEKALDKGDLAINLLLAISFLFFLFTFLWAVW